MELKDTNGNVHDVTSIGQGTYNTIAGSLGLARFLGLGANNGNGIGGILGGNNNPAWVSKDEANANKQIATLEMQNAILTSEKNTTQQMLDLFKYEDTKREQERTRLDSMQKEYTDLITAEREARLLSEKEQAVFNAQATQGISTTAAQVASMQQVLNTITTSVIPSNKVCDTGCCCNN